MRTSQETREHLSERTLKLRASCLDNQKIVDNLGPDVDGDLAGLFASFTLIYIAALLAAIQQNCNCVYLADWCSIVGEE